ncbi:DUF397 domain-containing protein [Streptomyces sp. NBC_01089]|uniref:DUF397 domain-containing protein n=1 Tax=Streptomyces sp. NBC_01089 TaxID=2903747 RepID=UPI00386BF292|nr:DUF397 domain-containing protein [Streptomyces sp. NBC_01089]
MNSNARIDLAFVSDWRKSSYSGPGNDDCLEVADGYADIPVRDSKNPHGPALVFPATGWESFVTAVKGGHLTA